MDHPQRRSGRVLAWALWMIVGIGAVAAYIVYAHFHTNGSPVEQPPLVTTATPDLERRTHEFCGACHAYPPPDTFPRAAWRREVERGYEFFSRAGMNLEVPPLDEVVAYYEQRAPEALPAAKF